MFWLARSNISHLICGNRLATCAVQHFSQTASRNTVVVERWWQIPLSKEGSPPRLNPRRHRIYKLVEDTKHAPKEKMELILTQAVPKLGGRGDTVQVPKSIGRNKLLPQGLAVYPSPENQAMFVHEKKQLREGKLEDRVQTSSGQKTAEFLRKAKLVVPLHTSKEYQISKEIIGRYFQKELGMIVPTHAITLPEEPITTVGESWCEVTVNGIDTIRVPLEVETFENYYASRYVRGKAQGSNAAEDSSDEA
ncbi:39S ribosomal protein L9, mitochondrial [Engraulis encrasicolus]|uniref:39S ribosomal protein L9, mitochondrial n=1 Tax=Engraulis encrasicolus TaxID=184585 RepID=UPI002FD32D63